jgi:hypothetical protein
VALCLIFYGFENMCIKASYFSSIASGICVASAIYNAASGQMGWAAIAGGAAVSCCLITIKEAMEEATNRVKAQGPEVRPLISRPQNPAPGD